MNGGRYRTKPKRKARHELLVLASVFALPAALAAVFPFRTGKTDLDRAPAAPSCAFVELDGEAAAAAVAKVRTVLSGRAGRERPPMADLSSPTFGATPLAPAMDVEDRAAPPRMKPHSATFAPFPPSLAAPAPEFAPRTEDEEAPPAAFPREELLKLE